MKIRKALPSDALGIKKVHVAAYQVSYRGYLPDDYLGAKTVVDPLFQKQGVGTKLAEYVTGLKKKAGYTKCAVWTLKFGPSLPFYHKMGFIETQNEKKWHPQEFADIPIIELSKNL